MYNATLARLDNDDSVRFIPHAFTLCHYHQKPNSCQQQYTSNTIHEQNKHKNGTHLNRYSLIDKKVYELRAYCQYGRLRMPRIVGRGVVTAMSIKSPI